MNIEQIEEAAERGQPFALITADGAKFDVPHPDFISFPPKSLRKRSFVVVYKPNGVASMLSLITITTLTLMDEAEAV